MYVHEECIIACHWPFSLNWYTCILLRTTNKWDRGMQPMLRKVVCNSWHKIMSLGYQVQRRFKHCILLLQTFGAAMATPNGEALDWWQAAGERCQRRCGLHDGLALLPVLCTRLVVSIAMMFNVYDLHHEHEFQVCLHAIVTKALEPRFRRKSKALHFLHVGLRLIIHFKRMQYGQCRNCVLPQSCLFLIVPCTMHCDWCLECSWHLVLTNFFISCMFALMCCRCPWLASRSNFQKDALPALTASPRCVCNSLWILAGALIWRALDYYKSLN